MNAQNRSTLLRLRKAALAVLRTAVLCAGLGSLNLLPLAADTLTAPDTGPRADRSEQARPLHASDRRKLDLFLYGGKFSDTNFGQILLSQQTDYKESFVAVGGVNYLLDGQLSVLRFETEGQFVKHFGIMRHTEVNGVLIARWPEPIGLPVSLAFGEGLSWASKRPRLEETGFNPVKRTYRRQETRALLNYLVVEVEFAIPGILYSQNLARFEPRAFIRLHHRSGVFGTYCPPTCGSNFLAYGIKFRYN